MAIPITQSCQSKNEVLWNTGINHKSGYIFDCRWAISDNIDLGEIWKPGPVLNKPRGELASFHRKPVLLSQPNFLLQQRMCLCSVLRHGSQIRLIGKLPSRPDIESVFSFKCSQRTSNMGWVILRGRLTPLRVALTSPNASRLRRMRVMVRLLQPATDLLSDLL